MASLISIATGNYSSASTWGTVELGSNAFLDTEAASTALTTSTVYSSTFTGLTSTIDGILLKLVTKNIVPSGTMTVVLNDGAVDTRTVTINVSDLTTNLGGATAKPGWVFFKFGSTITLVAGTTYKVGAKTSSASMVTLYRNATAGNWARMLRTTTTAAPAASDQTVVCGEYISAGSSNAYTVTWDIVSSVTTYGKINVSSLGTFACGTAASAYYMKLNGDISLYDGGVITFGTSGTPLPAGSSLTVEFVSVAAGDFGLSFTAGSFEAKHATEKTPYVLLGADAAAAATSITLASVPTNWLSGDSVAIEPTTRTTTEFETKALSANVTTTTASIAALTNAHGGNSSTGVQGAVGILTQGIVIKGTSSSLTGYVNIGASATVVFRNVELTNMGANLAGKKGIDIATTTGSTSFQYCSLHDFLVSTVQCFLGAASGTLNNIVIQNCVVYNMSGAQNSTTTGSCFTIQSATSGTNIILSDSLICGSPNNTRSVYCADNGIQLYNLRLSGFQSVAITLAESGAVTNLHDINAHSNGDAGIAMGNVTYGDGQATISNLTLWRNGTYGFLCGAVIANYTFDTIVAFGNTTAGMTTVTLFNVILKNCLFDAGSTLTQPVGLSLNASGYASCELRDCLFGTSQTHATGDLQVLKGSSASTACNVLLINCLTSSTVEVATPSSMSPLSLIKSMKHDQTTGFHKWWSYAGVGSLDSSFSHSASPSTRLTPSSATIRLESAPQAAAVDSGGTVTFSVWVRKSVIGDGAAYNGADQPRLVLKANVAAGISSDVVLATATNAANGAWEQLTGTTSPVTTDAGALQVVVDCDGTAGWVNIDDFTAS